MWWERGPQCSKHRSHRSGSGCAVSVPIALPSLAPQRSRGGSDGVTRRGDWLAGNARGCQPPRAGEERVHRHDDCRAYRLELRGGLSRGGKLHGTAVLRPAPYHRRGRPGRETGHPHAGRRLRRCGALRSSWRRRRWRTASSDPRSHGLQDDRSASRRKSEVRFYPATRRSALPMRLLPGRNFCTRAGFG